MFKKILVANRGEIARRVILACRELGVRAVAVYSEADAQGAWVRLADEAYLLAGVTAVQTYLNQPAILAIAQASGAEAIHPGYGFLSENAAFAEACARHNVLFIGPSPAAMRQMGSKAAARELAQRAGVPVVPGVDGAGKRDVELLAAANDIGYPVLIKASAGGGGKGMRVVHSADAFLDALRQARAESQSAFGSDHVLLEKFFTDVHHVEIQVLGDHHGRLLHLYERECSIQRRHQKIIEESPAPIIQDERLRQAMAEAAVALAREAGYVNAGTVEFIVDGVADSQATNGRFYFLEMNTRLQVEHPLTEQVTGLDLVVWQIRVAAGEALPFAQEAISQRGHAIECRIYAEDPANDFLPSMGEIGLYQRPFGPGVRVDDGLEAGTAVTPYYDPMLAKVITWGQDRPEAVRKMVRALQETVILGVTTNIPYLLAILQEAHFVNGRTNTSYLADYMSGWSADNPADETIWLALAALELLATELPFREQPANAQLSPLDPWDFVKSWRNVFER